MLSFVLPLRLRSFRWGIGLFVAGIMLLPVGASAIPLYARQTGQQCAGCHTAFPELNAFGRQFKLLGYTLGERQAIPLSAMAMVSTTRIKDNSTFVDPQPRDGSLVFEGGSVFTGGKITDNLGAFVQWSYDNLAGPGSNGGHSAIDNVDFRYAGRTAFGSQDMIWGLTLHNAPGVQEVWNAVPAWSFPFQSPKLANFQGSGPDKTFLDNAPRITGLGAYGFWNNMVYGELTAYRTSDKAFSVLRAGNTQDPLADRTTLKGYNPYWSLALSQDFGAHSAMVGVYGIVARQFASFQDTDQPTTKFTDQAVNGQYQYVSAPHTFSAQAGWIRERRNYDFDVATASGAHDNPSAVVHSLNAKATYYYAQTYGITVGHFATTTDADAAAFGGSSFNNKGDSSGMTYELNYVPIQNLRLSAQYTAYSKFFGGSSYISTDSNGNSGARRASANNTLYLYGWLAY